MIDRDIPEIACCGKSDIGLRRAKNEDAFLVRPDLGFFLVADGMGGAASGEKASRMFAETALEVFAAKGVRSGPEIVERVKSAFISANERILDHVKRNSQDEGMACTAELMGFYHGGFAVGHIGDSRTYLLRNGQLKQLTRDHSLVQDQIDQGMITEAEARNHPRRNVILRAVGTNEKLALDIVRGKTSPGDLFLLCSDGLTDMIENTLIQRVLLSKIALTQKANKLIGLAKSAGGNDNISVVVCEIL